MLHEFLIANRATILSRSREKLAARQVPTPTESELANGLPLFLDQIIGILRSKKGERGPGHLSVSEGAAAHGGNLLQIGLTVGQVVQDYGSICQSVTELADETKVAITADEFHIFNRCLDEAIAQAVTSYEQHRDHARGGPGVAQLGFLAHEMRNLLGASMLAFDALSRGNVGIHGSTGAVLGRSLRGMRVLIDRTLAEVRLEADIQKPERVSVALLIEEMEVVATPEANDLDISLSIDPGPHGLTINGDHQILASSVANLVQNALKFTRKGGHIAVRAHTTEGRVLIEVEDECGGLPPGKAEELFRPFQQRGANREKVGMGLMISLKGVQASGGEIRVRDLPAKGCVFTVDLPLAVAVPEAP